MLESSLVKYGDESISYTIGEPLKVVFDYETVWEYFLLQKPKNPALLHFVHVHPSGSLGYSELDLHCLKGFNIGFGFPVYFSILCFDSLDLNCLDHKMATYQYHKETDTVQRLDDPKFTKSLALANIEVSALKLLSYCPGSVIEILCTLKS